MKNMKGISFASHWDFISYLHHTGPLINKAGCKIMWIDGYNPPIRIDTGNGLLLQLNKYPEPSDIFYTPRPWYENIPEGKYVTCWVSKNSPDPSRYHNSAAVSYDPEGNKDFPFTDIDGHRYTYATPRTDIWVPE